MNYLKKMHKVDGWFLRESAETFCAIDQAQKDIGIAETVGEIGVHHGKSFILLSLFDRSFAIDTFNVAENDDASGHGDLEIFKRNLARFSYPSTVTIIKAQSQTLTPKDIPGPVRIFSVDGGHTAYLTENDLWLADKTLTEGGVAILDDYFNPLFPDVSTGAQTYFSKGTLFPFAISPNKLYLTNNEEASRNYITALAAMPQFDRFQEMCGHKIAVIGTSRARKIVRNPIYLKYRSAPWMQPLKAIARRFI